jgi:hypothetical protein
MYSRARSIHTQLNFLDEAKCKFLTATAAELLDWKGGGHPFWANRVYNLNLLTGRAAEIGERLVSDVREFIQCRTSIPNVYCDSIDLIRWPIGYRQAPHYDACEQLEHREWGTVLYLNDDYQGGRTYYPTLYRWIEPRAGTLVVHPGDKDFLHGVSEVTRAVRYTIAGFWTTNVKKALHDRLNGLA